MLQDWHLFNDAWVVEVDENKRLFIIDVRLEIIQDPVGYIKKYNLSRFKWCV